MTPKYNLYKHNMITASRSDIATHNDGVQTRQVLRATEKPWKKSKRLKRMTRK